MISIVTVTIDSDEILERTLWSVAQQKGCRVEHIVVDGAWEKREKDFYERFTSVKFYRQAPEGIYNAINFGLSKCTGDVIGILHGGDTLRPDILQRIASMFEAQPALDLVFGDIRYFNFEKKRGGRTYSANCYRPEFLAYGMSPPHPSMYVRKRILDQIGPYRTDFRIAADLDMWMRIFKRRDIVYEYVPEIFVDMSTGGLSTKLSSKLYYNNIEKMKALRLNGYSANPMLLLGKYLLILRNIFSK